MSDPETVELCHRIYRKHQKAIDLIVENIPDRRETTREVLERLIAANQVPTLLLDDSNNSYIRFAPKQWDVPEFRVGKGWMSTGRILLFEFNNNKDSLGLSLYIGPGPEEIRQKLLDLALQNQPPLKPASRTLNRQWNTIFGRPFVSKRTYQEAVEQRETDEKLEAEIKKCWAEFTKNDLPRILEVIQTLLRRQ